MQSQDVPFVDCQSTVGSRCIDTPLGAADPSCVDMRCSPDGDVLVNGAICDPGTLTTLNYCARARPYGGT